MLTGAKGVNLWTAFRVPPPQRSARLYKAVVERGLASSLHGAMLPTADPFLYTLSATATQGTSLGALEDAALQALDLVVAEGITDEELARARRQLHAQMVFDADSVTNVAHQLGFFETIGGVDLLFDLPRRIAATTVADVNGAAAALFKPSNRTIGCFEPLPVGRGEPTRNDHEAHR